MSVADLSEGVGGVPKDATPSRVLVARGRGALVVCSTRARACAGGLANDLTARSGGTARGAADVDDVAVFRATASSFGADEVGNVGEVELA